MRVALKSLSIETRRIQIATVCFREISPLTASGRHLPFASAYGSTTRQVTRLNQTSDSVSATTINSAATAANNDVISRLLRSRISREFRLW